MSAERSDSQRTDFQKLKSPGRTVLLLDADMVVTGANEAAKDLFGCNAGELIGLSGGDLILRLFEQHRSLDPVAEAGLAECYRNPDKVSEDVIQIAPPDSRVLHRYGTPIFGPDGAVQGRIEVYSDITSRRELEREVIKRNEDMARLNRELEATREQLVRAEKFRSLGEMAAGVAHDLNNVLGVVLANAQLILRGELPAEQRKRLEAIQMAALDGAETVRRIRELVQERPGPAHVPVDMNEIVSDVVKVTEPGWKTETAAQGSFVSMETLTGDIPPVMGNPAELRELLANLLLNSAQAMPNGGKVMIRTFERDERALLQVEDTGIGMSDEVKRRAFDPFFTTRGPEGTGLGLSIAYAITKRHGGEIEIESEEGIGTTVTVSFPVAKAVSTQVLESPPLALNVASARVMIVDDEEMYAKALGELVGESGHKVSIAVEPSEALAGVLRHEYDLVLADLAMPGMSGLELAQAIRKSKPNLPIILLTGWADFLDEKDAEQSGVNVVLAKPVTMDDLNTAIAECLSGK